MIPSDAPDELESERLRKAMHFLAELGAVVASSTQLQPILDWVVLKTTGMLAADEGCLRLIEADPTTSQTIVRPRSQQLASGSWPPGRGDLRDRLPAAPRRRRRHARPARR